MSSKHKRSYAKGRFTRAVNGFEAFVKTEAADDENLKRYYGDVENTWHNIEKRHEEYISTLTTDEEIAAEEPWIEELHTKFQDIRERYVKFVSNYAVLSDRKSREKARTIEYETFNKLYKNLEYSVENKYASETITREKTILEHQFETVKLKHSEFCFHCDDDSTGKINTDWLLRLIGEFSKINSLADKYIKSEQEKRSECKVKNIVKGSNVKMEKMPLSRFTGDPRFYHRFKRDFNDLVRPNLEDREAAFTFRQCLGKEVEIVLGSGDFDVDQMIKRLDEKFGEPSKIIDSIISEIQKYKKIDNDDSRRLIELINIVERAFYDLRSLKMEKEISNCNVVSLIECKLPKNVALNWYRFIYTPGSKVEKTNKFPHLLEFLINERKALEYGMGELRITDRRYSIHYTEKSKILACLLHDSSSHNTANCRSYLNMNINDRYTVLKDKFACFSCLSSGHMMNECQSKVKCTDCEKFHHVTLHPIDCQTNVQNSAIRGSACTVSHMDPSEAPGNSCIFPIMKVKVGYGPHYANILWDSCASICLITKEKADLLGLKGAPSEISLTVVGGTQKTINSEKYQVPLIDLRGQRFIIEAYSIDIISREIKGLNSREIRKCFPGLAESEFRRPHGKIDMLIGYNYAAWHPVCENKVGHLLVLSNSFGKCIGGSHPEISEKTEKSEEISYVINLVSNDGLSAFSTIEALGTEFIPKCGKCQCGNCPLGGKNCSIKEQREMALIERNLELSPNGYWIAGYPWIKNPENLPDNRQYVLKLLKQTENRLQKNPEFERAYCDQINDMFSREVARKVTESELLEYRGPVHYIAHHAVYKPSSKTTPLRIVFNSSAQFKGHILNEYWAKGPNVFLNTLFGILIRFRENYVGFIGDVKKMYNSVRIKLLDQHCHRFLWRDMKLDTPPETYVITRANMGDKPSGTIASLALRKTAELDRENYPIEYEIIVNSTYMDDIIDCTDTVESAISITSNISKILRRGHFNIKEWIMSRNKQTDVKAIDISNDTEKVLGMYWVLQGDYFKFEVHLNFSRKRGNLRTEHDLSLENFEQLVPKIITKRMVLSQINGIFDPLGLVSPFVVKGKILLRQLCLEKFGWDDPITEKMRLDWMKFFREMFELNNVHFNRAVKPVDATNEPMLIIFSDASREAYGAVCYIRWELKNGTFSSTLLLSKSKIAPTKVITIVRLELLAAVIGKRLRLTIEKECRLKFRKVIHIVDSEIVRAMINRESYGFNTFTSTRIGEIQEGSDPSDWYWIGGEHNVADIVSRGESPKNLFPNSVWQMGPKFLTTPFTEWPTRQDCSTDSLPERIETVMKIETNLNEEVIDCNRFSNFIRLIRVTARILSLKEKREHYSFHRISEPVTVQKYNEAILYWIRLAQGWKRQISIFVSTVEK